MASMTPKTSRWKAMSTLQRIVIILLVIIAVLAFAAWTATIVLRPHPPTPAAITADMKAQAALAGGAQVYATHCGYCHDKGFAPSIAGRDLPPEAVTALVRMGPAMMPSFTISQISDADIVAVTQYINGLPAKPEETK